MKLTKEELEIIREYNDLKVFPDDDNIRFKNKIKKFLLDENNYKSSFALAYFLNNEDLNPRCIDEYFDVNIFPHMILLKTQTTPMNYICYRVGFSETSNYSENRKIMNITFWIMCDAKTVKVNELGVERHDILGAIIRDSFNWGNLFGTQCRVVEDQESTTDSNYATRKIMVELVLPNSLTKKGKFVGHGLNNSIRST